MSVVRHLAHAANGRSDMRYTYRIVYGSSDNEQGYVEPIDASTDEAAFKALRKALRAFGPDSWGRVEYTSPDMWGWDRLSS